MITDKDRAELKELTKQIRKSNQPMQWFDYGWDECAEIIMRYVEKKNAEYAEQARKEAAEVAVAFIRTLNSESRDLWGEYEDNGLRAAILGDSVIKENLTTDHIPDIGKKLAIAVKALGNIIDGNDLACERGESMASWMDSDFRRQAKDALKEIQG